MELWGGPGQEVTVSKMGGSWLSISLLSFGPNSVPEDSVAETPVCPLSWLPILVAASVFSPDWSADTWAQGIPSSHPVVLAN